MSPKAERMGELEVERVPGAKREEEDQRAMLRISTKATITKIGGFEEEAIEEARGQGRREGRRRSRGLFELQLNVETESHDRKISARKRKEGRKHDNPPKISVRTATPGSAKEEEVAGGGEKEEGRGARKEGTTITRAWLAGRREEGHQLRSNESMRKRSTNRVSCKLAKWREMVGRGRRRNNLRPLINSLRPPPVVIETLKATSFL